MKEGGQRRSHKSEPSKEIFPKGSTVVASEREKSDMKKRFEIKSTKDRGDHSDTKGEGSGSCGNQERQEVSQCPQSSGAELRAFVGA